MLKVVEKQQDSCNSCLSYSGFFAKHLWYTNYISTTREWNYLIWIWIIHFLIARGESSPTRIISSLQNSTSFEAVTCAAPVFFHICESAVVPIGSNEVVDIFGSEFCKSKLQELWPSSSWYSPAKSWQGKTSWFPEKNRGRSFWGSEIEDLKIWRFHFLESTPPSRAGDLASKTAPWTPLVASLEEGSMNRNAIDLAPYLQRYAWKTTVQDELHNDSDSMVSDMNWRLILN